MEYRIATEKDLEVIWNKNIKFHSDDARWKKWKQQYIGYNREGKAVTFVAVDDEPVGEITLLLSPECNAVKGKKELCDGKSIFNMNAFRIEKKYEGQGHISKLEKLAEAYAKEHGAKELSIGVEATEIRNMAIYFHWGFERFIFSEIDEEEGGVLVLYYKKKI